LSDDSLLAKYHSLADPVLGRDGAAALAQRVLQLGQGDDLRGLVRMTQTAAS
jgi:hypothetical protein